MRVGFIVSDYPEVSETFISRKVDFLQQVGHEVVVFRTAPRPGTPDAGHNGGVWLENLSNKTETGLMTDVSTVLRAFIGDPGLALRTLRHRSPYFSRLTQLARYDQVRRLKLDLLHVHFVRQLLPVFGIRKALGLPVVVSMWSTDGFDVVDLKRVSHEADVLHAVSDFVAQEFRQTVSDEHEAEVLPPEIRCSHFSCERQYEDRKPWRIVTIARLHWMKGVLYAIHVAHRLKAHGIPFTYDIVGEGPQRLELEKAVRDLQLQEHVSLRGSREPEEIPTLLKNADVFLFPSVQETFGVALLEAQASGLPIVACRVGGIPEAVRDSETAILTSPRDVVGMANAVERLLSDSELRKTMGTKGKEYAKRFDCQLIGARLLEMYQKALKACGKISERGDMLHV